MTWMMTIGPLGLAWTLFAVAAYADTVEQLYEKGKAEASLHFCAGGPTAPYEARIKEFMEKFPGIQVSVSGGFSNELNQRIEQQIADRKLAVDFALFQTVQDFVNWKRRGELLAFKPDGFDQIMPNLRDEHGAYLSFAANTIGYAYNTNLVRAEEVPRSALDFLKPALSYGRKLVTA
jgi:ABC-type glycerol-3-phosphate transport system substrate-binding protein